MKVKLLHNIFHQTWNQYYHYSSKAAGGKIVNICVFGGHQSGKTHLCSAITKALSQINSTRFVPINVLDSTPDEKQSGSTKMLSFAKIVTPNAKCTLIDCPGRPDLPRGRVKALSISDLGILVVPHDNISIDTVQQQLRLARHFKLQDLVLFLTKSDLMANDTNIDKATSKLKDILREYEYQDNLILFGSPLSLLKGDASHENWVEELINHIDGFQVPDRDSTAPLQMNFIQVSVIGRNDAYASVYVNQGSLEIGKTLRILGKGLDFSATLSEIISSHSDSHEVGPGSFCEIMLRGNRCKWLSSGMIATESNDLETYDDIECQVEPFPNTDSLNTNSLDDPPPFDLLSDQLKTNCFLELLDQEDSSHSYRFNIKLSHSLVLTEGHRFALGRAKHFVGLGKVTKLLPVLSKEDKLNLFRKDKILGHY